MHLNLKKEKPTQAVDAMQNWIKQLINHLTR